MTEQKRPLLIYAAIAVAVVILIAWRVLQPKAPEVAVEIVTTGAVQATVSNTKAGTIEACRRAGISPYHGQSRLRTFTVSRYLNKFVVSRLSFS